jgi:protein ImuA
MIFLDDYRPRGQIIANLRRLLPRLEHDSADRRVIALEQRAIDMHLPRGGLDADSVHEIAPQHEKDAGAVFGFVAAIGALIARAKPVLFAASPRGLAHCGGLHGHGMKALGLDPARVMMVATNNEENALWAMEEGLHSSVPGVVIGAIGKDIKLKQSQRLSLAAGKAGVPLLLLRPAEAWGSTAATTRWRIGGAEAARDRFGLITRYRWRAKLERCRNGRLGEWMVEFDHVAHRFSMAAPLADHAVSGERGEERVARHANRS